MSHWPSKATGLENHSVCPLQLNSWKISSYFELTRESFTKRVVSQWLPWAKPHLLLLSFCMPTSRLPLGVTLQHGSNEKSKQAHTHLHETWDRDSSLFKSWLFFESQVKSRSVTSMTQVNSGQVPIPGVVLLKTWVWLLLHSSYKEIIPLSPNYSYPITKTPTFSL